MAQPIKREILYQSFERLNRIKDLFDNYTPPEKSNTPDINAFNNKKKFFKQLCKFYNSGNYVDVYGSNEFKNTYSLANKSDGDIITEIISTMTSGTPEENKQKFNALIDDTQNLYIAKYKAYTYLQEYYEELLSDYTNNKQAIIKAFYNSLESNEVNNQINELINMLPEQTNLEVHKNMYSDVELLGKIMYILMYFYNCKECEFNRKKFENIQADFEIITLFTFEYEYKIDIQGEQIIRKPLFILYDNEGKPDNETEITFDTENQKFEKLYNDYYILYQKFVNLDESDEKKPKLVYDIMCVLKALMEFLVSIDKKYTSYGDDFSNFKSILIKYVYDDHTQLKPEAFDNTKVFFGLYELPKNTMDLSKGNQLEIHYSFDILKDKATKQNKNINEYLNGKWTILKENGNQYNFKNYVPPILYALYYFSTIETTSVNVMSYLEDLEKDKQEIITFTGKNTTSNTGIITATLNTNNQSKQKRVQLEKDIIKLIESMKDKITSFNEKNKGYDGISRLEGITETLSQYYQRIRTVKTTNPKFNKELIIDAYNKLKEKIESINSQLDEFNSKEKPNGKDNDETNSYISEANDLINTINYLITSLETTITELENQQSSAGNQQAAAAGNNNNSGPTQEQITKLTSYLDELKTLVQQNNSIQNDQKNKFNELLDGLNISQIKTIEQYKQINKILTSLEQYLAQNTENPTAEGFIKSQRETMAGGARKSPKKKARNHSRRRLRSILNKKKHTKKN